MTTSQAATFARLMITPAGWLSAMSAALAQPAVHGEDRKAALDSAATAVTTLRREAKAVAHA